MKYGKLTILSYSKKGAYKTVICKCDCGNIKEIYLSNLVSKRTQSCGCLEKENQKKYNDISGNRYGNIKVIEITDRRDKSRRIIWKCLCDCGTIFYCPSVVLSNGSKTHCGCQSRNKCNITNKRFGRLIAIELISNSNLSRCKWRCKCDCEEKCLVQYGEPTFWTY
ncbi:hypothetical protein MCG01_04980 [Enterococcus hirae]|nr:hypothetical protein [Enterococcus hirae]